MTGDVMFHEFFNKPKDMNQELADDKNQEDIKSE